MTREVVDHCLMLIEPGDILLSHENQRLTSIFIKGFYDHAVIVTDKLTVMEAVGDDFETVNGERINKGGVREMDLEEWLYKKDYVAIIRPTYDAKIRERAGANAYKWKGFNYDYSFSLESADVYCSELVFLCYNEVESTFLKEIKPEVSEILPEAYLNPNLTYLKVIFKEH